MSRKAVAVVAGIVTLALAGCGSSGSSAGTKGDGAPGGITDGGGAGTLTGGARIEITPGGLLLSGKGKSFTLTAIEYDDQGNHKEVTATWASSRPETIVVDTTGKASAMAGVGSALIVATVGDKHSAPILALIAELKAGAVPVSDDQIMVAPVVTDPTRVGGPGNRFRVTLTGVEAPAAGAILVSTGGKPLAGRVISTSGPKGQMVVEAETVMLEDVFQSLEIDEKYDLSVLRSYELKEGQGSPFDLSPAPAMAPALPARSDHEPSSRQGDDRIRVTPGSGRTLDAEAEKTIWGFKCKASATFSIDPGKVVEIKFDEKFEVPFSFVIRTGKLTDLKLAVTGKFTASASVGLSLQAALQGEIKCERQLKVIPIPLGGALSLIVSPAVPLGVGFSLQGKLPVVGVEWKGTATFGSTTTVGFEWHQGKGFTNLTDFKPEGKMEQKLSLPGDKYPRLDASLDVYGYAGLSLVTLAGQADDFLQAFLGFTGSFELLRLTLGPRFETSLGLVRDQAADPAYASNYELKLRGQLGMGKDLAKALSVLKVTETDEAGKTSTAGGWKIFDFKATTDLKVAESPVGTVKVDKLMTQVGEPVTFTITLDPQKTVFAGAYNVREIRIYQLTKLLGAFTDAALVATVAAKTDQTDFTYAWMGKEDELGEHTFAVFVVPDHLISLPMEIGKNTLSRVTLWSGVPVDGCERLPIPSFRVIDLAATFMPAVGNLPNDPWGINDLGQVVGATQIPTPLLAGGTETPYLWDKGTVIRIPVEMLANQALVLNNAGRVAGSWVVKRFDSKVGGPLQHGFFWQNGSFVDLGPAPNGTFSNVNGINEHGDMVGEAFWPDMMGGGTFEATSWVDQKAKALGRFPSTQPNVNYESHATGINAGGVIVGDADVDYMTATGQKGTARHAFYSNGSLLDLGTLGGRNSYATAINDRGMVAGKSETTILDANVNAFVWVQGKMVDLDPAPKNVVGEMRSAAVAINNLCQIVCDGAVATAAGPFLSQNGIKLPLTSLILAKPGWTFPTPEWIPEKVRGINNHGQIVVKGRHLVPGNDPVPAVFVLDPIQPWPK